MQKFLRGMEERRRARPWCRPRARRSSGDVVAVADAAGSLPGDGNAEIGTGLLDQAEQPLGAHIAAARADD